MNWNEYPQIIEYWGQDTDYAMFIDENGNASKINDIFKKITNGEKINEDNKFFTITGCIFTRQNYSKASGIIKSLKLQYWKDGFYYDNKKQLNQYVCLHSRDIRRHDNAFNDSLINHKQFTDDLTKILNNVNCTIISVSINLELYLKDGHLNNVYETAFDFLLERYIYTTKNYKKGIIILESRGKKEDKQLLKHIVEVINKGRKNIPSSELKDKISGIYFNPKWNKEHKATYAGLEIVDLFSYPIHQFIKYNSKNDAFKVLESKLDGYPNYINKGIKVFPNQK